jgi:hypothetical protein
VAAAGVAAYGLLSGDGTNPETADPASITLQPVRDDGGTARLSWTGPAALDYAVEVAAQGQSSSTVLAGRTTTLAVTVDPEVPYCFRITATDARSVLTSNVQPVRGATCAG